MKWQATKTVAFTPRFEWYHDRDGATTGGTPQKLKELTATLELRANDNLQWRLSTEAIGPTSQPFLDSDGNPRATRIPSATALLFRGAEKFNSASL